jgi:hypothetical protein
MPFQYRHLDWCLIEINLDTGGILVQERWKFHWRVRDGLRDWTDQEKSSFQLRADRAIWGMWSGRATLSAVGGSDFARRHAGRRLPVNFDIQPCTSQEHWNVTVWMIAPREFRQSSVNWTARRITLDINDFDTRRSCQGTGAARQCSTQVPITHEFGHSVGNTSVLSRGDEYRSSSAHSADRDSMLNVGDQLRVRHFQTLIEELNQIWPGTRFSVSSLR